MQLTGRQDVAESVGFRLNWSGGLFGVCVCVCWRGAYCMYTSFRSNCICDIYFSACDSESQWVFWSMPVHAAHPPGLHITLSTPPLWPSLNAIIKVLLIVYRCSEGCLEWHNLIYFRISKAFGIKRRTSRSFVPSQRHIKVIIMWT